MTDTIAIFYDPKFIQYDLGPHHPLRQERIQLHYELSRSLGLLDQPGVIEPDFDAASDKILQLVHTKDYIERIHYLSQQEGYHILDQGDTRSFPGVYDISRLKVGGTIAAVDAVMTGRTYHAWNPGGGLHHAHPDQASGFCIFNDVAIACRYLQTQYNAKRILYLDIDVHHADGVQDIFYHDPGVLTLSIHETGRILFPRTGFTEELGEGEGRGYSVNLPLPPYVLDDTYLKAFDAIVPPIIEGYQPEVIVMQNGVDTHFQDQLGHLALTTSAFEAITTRMKKLVKKFTNNQLISVGGGGYSYLSVPRCWTLILSKLIGVEVADQIPSEWQQLFKEITGLNPPSHLRDKDVPYIAPMEYQRIERLVSQSIENVRQLVFPLLGIEQ